MLQEKEILFDDPEELTNNFEYTNNLKSTAYPSRDNSKFIKKTEALNLNNSNHQVTNQSLTLEKSFLLHHPTSSSNLDQADQDLLLAKRLQEAEMVCGILNQL
jgi:hypothetical protein